MDEAEVEGYLQHTDTLLQMQARSVASVFASMFASKK